MGEPKFDNVRTAKRDVKSKERQAAYALWKKTPAFHRTVKRGEPGVTDWLRAERDGVMASS